MIRASILLLATLAPANADIVVDLPIVGALVETVTDTPVRVLAEGSTDPHGLTLRPSQARALADAELVVHLGSGLSPALERAIAGSGAPVLNLAEIVGAAEDADEQAHDSDHDHDDDHDHDGADPHLWLDARYLEPWMLAIGQAVGGSAPREPGLYATRFEQALQRRMPDLPSPPPRLLLAHDSWSRLLSYLDLPDYPAISDSHAGAPGAQHLGTLRETIAEGGIDCILTAPGDPIAQSESLSADFDLPVVTADPQGDPTLDGLDRYVSIFTGFAEALADCQAKSM